MPKTPQKTQKTVLGLDVGSNSIGWALLKEKNGAATEIIDLGCRIFIKAVEEKTPTPKNQQRRQARLARRVLQRRARRKQRMLNYLISLDLLPKELQDNPQPELLLNQLGDPYALRAKALDKKLTPYELGRILLHFVARRGFLSNKKQLAGDLIDDPDYAEYLRALGEDAETDDKPADEQTERDKEETEYKQAIQDLRQKIATSTARTLGEYLHNRAQGDCKRNRLHGGGHLRTERKMYQDELAAIWKKQKTHFPHLPPDFMEKGKGVQEIIFYQRPLKLRKDRVGQCSLEPKKRRAAIARLQFQRFRYLQDINHLRYGDAYTGTTTPLDPAQRKTLADYLERNPKITHTQLATQLGLPRKTQFNLDLKTIKGNTTACKIRTAIGDHWDKLNETQQNDLFEDLLTIKKKSALKKRLTTHWKFSTDHAIQLCLLEFEQGHANHSLKAINKILPHLVQGLIYSKKDTETGELGALQAAGYTAAQQPPETTDKLTAPPYTANPIVNKGLHELKRVVNAVIKQHGKPDAIRIEMARDLEMNTKRYQAHLAQQKKNEKARAEAREAFTKAYPGKEPRGKDLLRYRLWKDQRELCAYSNQPIPLAQVFTAETEVDHILPFKRSLDDSYMNKVLCLQQQNRKKANNTPMEVWGGSEQWNQITRAIAKWDKQLKPKTARFHQTDRDLQQRDFTATSLNDTRYIASEAKEYVKQLGCDVSVTKGGVVANIRHQWGFNTLLSATDQKERTDHRHHAIDAVVIAATSRNLYTKAVKQIQRDRLMIDRPYNTIRSDLGGKLEKIIVSHAPQHKLSGALHEETGAGYVAKHGGLVYRKTLQPGFTKKHAAKIVDPTIKECVLAHLHKHGDDDKKAFAEGVTVYHKNRKTPIKRVRVLQSTVKVPQNKTAEQVLSEQKFGVKDKQGKEFKWMVLGNTHHVEILREKQSGKISAKFVTMMEAHHRAKGIGIPKQPIIKTDHPNHDFVMALHINDTVSVKNAAGKYYRVQKLEMTNNRITLRSIYTTTLNNPAEEIVIHINKTNFVDKYQIQKHRVNAIGRLTDD